MRCRCNLGLTALCFFAVGAAAQKPAPAPLPPARLDSSFFTGLTWREIGPFRGGRVDAVVGDPEQPLVFYFGATGGGVWKTTDGGLTWRPLGDGQLGAGSVGAIAVAGADANALYVGPGESTLRGNVSPGDGAYRSTDAGRTWTKIELADAGQIARIVVHPRNPDLVYAAAFGHVFGPNATRGVYRFGDGGKTWQRVLARGDSTGALAVAMDPSNPRILYAALWQAQRTPWSFSSGGAGSGLFKSTDGGDTWTELPRNKGMPAGVIGRIGIAVAPSNPDRVYALVEAAEGGLFRSDDAGATWTKVSDDHELRQRAWYFSVLAVEPQNPDAVWGLNVSLLKTIDGGGGLRPPRGAHRGFPPLLNDPQKPQRLILGHHGERERTSPEPRHRHTPHAHLFF